MEQQQTAETLQAYDLERSVLPTALKGTDGSILYSNDLFAALLGYHHFDQRPQMDASSLRHWIGSEVFDTWQAQDRRVLSQMRPLLMLDIVRVFDEELTPSWRPLLTTKYPSLDPLTRQPAIMMQCEPFEYSMLGRLKLLKLGQQSETATESHGLTTRETDVLFLLLRGATVKEIAQTLSISENTVRNHYLVNLKLKFDTTSLAQVIQRGINTGGLLLLPELRHQHWFTHPLTDEPPELSYPRQ